MVIPENYGEASAIYEYLDTGERMTTSFGFHNTPIDDAITIANQLTADWSSAFTVSTFLDSYRYVGMYVLIRIGGVLQSFQTSDNLDGDVSAEPVSPAIAVGVKKQTSYAGKKYRGRMYLCPAHISEANVNGAGVIDGATVSALQGKMDTILANVNADGYPMYLLHSDATDPTPVEALIVRDNVRTQRRRQRLR